MYDGPIFQLYRLIFDRAKQMTDFFIFTQFFRLRPGFTIILRGNHQPPPFNGTWTYLIIELERPPLRKEKDRIPAGIAKGVILNAIGNFLRPGPTAIFQARNPYSHVRVPFISSTKKCTDQT